MKDTTQNGDAGKSPWHGRMPFELLLDKRVKSQARDVYTALAAFVAWKKGDRAGIADVSMKALDTVGFGRSKVQRWLPSLVETGWIEKREQPNANGGRPKHIYLVHLESATTRAATYRECDTSSNNSTYLQNDTPSGGSTYLNADTSPEGSTYRNDLNDVSKTRPRRIGQGDTQSETLQIKSNTRSPSAHERGRVTRAARTRDNAPSFTDEDLKYGESVGLPEEAARASHANWIDHYYVLHPRKTMGKSIERWMREDADRRKANGNGDHHAPSKADQFAEGLRRFAG